MTVENVKLPITSPPQEAHDVGEGWLAVAEYPSASQGPSHLTSEGLQICKGVTIYDADAKRGLLAHISETPDPVQALQAIVEAYGGDLSNSDIHIVHTQQLEADNRSGFNPDHWPDTESITDFFMKHSPKSLRVDANDDEHPVRSIALNLADGAVTQYASPAGRAESKPPNVTVNQRINPRPQIDHTKFPF